MGAKTAAIATMTVRQILTNHGMLVGEYPGAPRGPDTLVGRVGVPANFC
jgi:hypothetical protein